MDGEVVIGLDPHKASNTIAVMDRTERVVARGRFRNDDAGITEMLDTVAAVAATNKWGFIYIFDRVTGTPLFPIKEIAVPKSTASAPDRSVLPSAWPITVS